MAARYRLKLGVQVRTLPTVGFNVEKREYKNIVFTVWDLGGQTRTRQIWQHYYQPLAFQDWLNRRPSKLEEY